MVKSEIIKIRATPYEKALVAELRKVSTISGVNVLNDSDVIRVALAAMAKQHLTAQRLKQLWEDHGE